ncbi:MAG: hypothetical protein BGO49_28525 [Planctomycetales bacterium 71-10]|nr:MAG: hypothetical protein BGO49_28525 [Planctomycetales bacterium 71-10]
MSILHFPHLPSHRDREDLILANYDLAEEHRSIELERRDPATDEGMGWLRESHARRMLAHEERQAVMLRAVMGVA